MSSAIPTHIHELSTSANALKQLRLAAGYSSAREFALELGIPESTYARYERAAAGPTCGIPIASAWAIADRLGCSIDKVVGREEPEVDGATLGRRVGALSAEARGLMVDYLEYLEHRDMGSR